MSRKVETVFEHGTLTVDGERFTEAEFDALVRYNEKHGNMFFDVGHKRLRFKSYVGVVQVGSLAIEILPKVEQATSEDQGKWRNALLQMLRLSGLINVKAAPEADLRTRRSSLVDLYLDSFLAETEAIVHRGLLKKYRITEENQFKLKGRIVFAKHIRQNSLHRERMYSAHEIYDRDNVYNQILKCAVTIVSRVALCPSLVTRASTVSLAFEQVSEARIIASTFEHLKKDRHTESYQKAIELAKLIILNYAPDLSGRQAHVIAILFDMNSLFERFVLSQLRRSLPNYQDKQLKVFGQSSMRFWGSKTIRPDIVVESGLEENRERVVLDTKWKLPDSGIPSDSDLKQMYVYNLHFDSRRAILIYPCTEKAQAGIKGQFEASRALGEEHRRWCNTFFVDLFGDTQELRKDIGDCILGGSIFLDSN